MTGTDDTPDFEDGLADLILESFGKGEEIEGTTLVEYERESMPTWAVKIRRSDE